MHSIFYGWRRKAGCFVLLIAFILMGIGYARNSNEIIRRDVILFEHKASPYVLVAKRETIVLVKVAGRESAITWQWRGGNLDFGQDDEKYSAPYWSVALPLALLSAYLILWKPRKRT